MAIILLLFLGLSSALLFVSLLFSFLFSGRNNVSNKGTVIVSSYPLIGCLISYYKNRRRLIDWYTDILSCSPSQTVVLSRFGAPRTIVTANPRNVEYVLKLNFNNYPKGKQFTEILGDFLGVGIFNVDGESWNAQRKFASHEFSSKSLRESVFSALDDLVRTRLDPLLNLSADSDAILDLQDVLKRFGFDTICKVILGVDPPPTYLDLTSNCPPLAEAMDKASELCAQRASSPVYAVWKFKKALNLGSEKLLKETVEKVHECVNEIIQAKKEKLLAAKNINNSSSRLQGSRDDLLSRSLMAGYDDKMVGDIVISFIMAGRDTTSSALTWFFWLLSRHEMARKKLADELTNLVEKTGEENSSNLNVSVLKEMNYMTASLCESMRLYPPVAWDSKHAREDDILPDGTVVYKGNRLTYFQYGMGRMEKLWGKDHSEFRPERWFDEFGVLKMVNPYEFPVFQAGPRVCLGKEMAFIQMKYVAASILRRFEIKPVSLNQPVFVPHMTAYMAGGFNVKVFSKTKTNTNTTCKK